MATRKFSEHLAKMATLNQDSWWREVEQEAHSLGYVIKSAAKGWPETAQQFRRGMDAEQMVDWSHARGALSDR